MSQLNFEDVREAMHECDEMIDGLFTVAGQGTLIEMTFYGTCDKPSYYLIETFKADPDYSFFNSAEPFEEETVRDCFPIVGEVLVFDDRAEAFFRYFELIERHHRLF